MWFEILPSFMVIFGAMAVGMNGGHFVMQAFHGKPFHKSLKTNTEIYNYVRDERLTGDAYKPQGLEAIKDEETSCK